MFLCENTLHLGAGMSSVTSPAFGSWLERHNLEPEKFAIVIDCADGEQAHRLTMAMKLDYDRMTWTASLNDPDFRDATIAGIKVKVKEPPSNRYRRDTLPHVRDF